ncbi:MAG TPA: ABC transporter ATP-binding protein [Vicinamibacterales bacterium]
MVALLTASQLYKEYDSEGTRVSALNGVSLEVAAGELVALMGPSGCGKSTLLHICGAMDTPTRGTIAIDGQNPATLDDAALTRLRRTRIGFVFQFFNLLPTLTVRENVALPLLLEGQRADAALAKAASLARRVGLGPRLDHRPSQLSGGELQRAAIARAVIHEPVLLVADEPTGSLDSANGAQVLELLVELQRERGVALLLATHAEEVAAVADRIVRMRDGRIEGEERGPRTRAVPVTQVVSQ